MKEDCLFKERFKISTPIQYLHDIVVDPRWQKNYERAWSRFQKKMEPSSSVYRRKRFDAFLSNIEKMNDDLAFCKKIEIRFINKKVGYGVFAKEKIAPYTILNHYAGTLKPDKHIIGENDSTFSFSDFKTYCIDAQDTGNWCRFMNHSPEGDPHTNVIAWEHYSQWGPRIIFTASRKGIQEGSQLLYSYGDTYWEEDSFLELS